tara:strand:+ start:148 stop:492 length:345 start_codon:yes stop_codon:yes gene_type:complete
VAQIPIINPKSEKFIEVIIINISIIIGYFISSGTKNFAVKSVTRPITIDFVAAAPTYPITISNAEIGADKISKIVPENLGIWIPKEALLRLFVINDNIIKPGTMKAPYATPSTV